MTKPTTQLLDVIKAARNTLQNQSSYRHLTNELNAHIAWRESGECVAQVQIAIIEAIHDKLGAHDREAKAAIKAMEGGE